MVDDLAPPRGAINRAATENDIRIKFLLSVGVVGALHYLKEEPLTPFALVDDDLQQTGCGHVAAAIAHFVRRPLSLGEVCVVLHKPPDHFPGRDEVIVVVLDFLQMANVGDGADRRAANATNPLWTCVTAINEIRCD